MIVSKPQTNTIVSFSFFLLITLVVLTMNIFALVRVPAPAWYNYLMVILLAPIGLFVFYKIFVRYKIIRLGNNRLELSYPMLRRHSEFPLQEIVAWKENVVKTGKNSVFKQLEIFLPDKQRISFGDKEHTEYGRVVQYLNQKLPKKKSA
ncbi:MAG: hypothetical protein RI909_119 [Bacteroidota bacterium]